MNRVPLEITGILVCRRTREGRYGINTADQTDGLKTGPNPAEEKAYAGLLELGRRYLFDERHGLQVAKLSVSLFDQMAGLHGLGKEERRLLLAAGILHDIGMFVNCRGHHRHSMHIISGSDIPGFTHRQIRIVANIARYHRKSWPSLNHGPFSRLKKKDRVLVETLSAILRIGDVLDREHRQEVVSVSARVRRDTLALQCRGKMTTALDRTAFKKKTEWFETLFKLKVTVPQGSIS